MLTRSSQRCKRYSYRVLDVGHEHSEGNLTARALSCVSGQLIPLEFSIGVEKGNPHNFQHVLHLVGVRKTICDHYTARKHDLFTTIAILVSY